MCANVGWGCQLRRSTHRGPRGLGLGVALAVLFGSQVATGQGQQNFWERLTDPTAAEARQAIGRATMAFQDGDAEALEAAIARAAVLEPEAPEVRYLEALADRRRGNPTASRDRLQALIEEGEFGEVKPEVVFADLAVALTQLGETEQAFAAYERALGLSPGPDRGNGDTSNRPIYLANMAELRMVSGALEEAQALYRHALRLRPDYVHALMGAAMVADRQGQREQSHGYLLRGILADPTLVQLKASTTFSVPPEDRDYMWGLIYEELGEVELATAHLSAFVAKAQQAERPVSPAQRALERMAAAGDPVVGHGPVPIYRATAVAADPLGRFIVFGGSHGKVVAAKLSARRVVWAPTLSGSRVVDLSITPSGALVVATADGFARRYEPRGGSKSTRIGPFALPAGADIAALSADGRLVLTTSGRRRMWSVAELAHPAVERVPFRLGRTVRRVELGRWDSRHTSLSAFFISAEGAVVMRRSPNGPEAAVVSPPAGTHLFALAPTSSGDRLVVAGSPYLAVVRVVDGRIMRLLRLPSTDPVEEVVIDATGAAGYGPAVLLVHADRYVALRLEAVLGPPPVED